MIERSIATGTHGRFLIEPPGAAGPAPMLVGFHGYGEGAEAQLERMRRIPGADGWLLLSIQGLHRFYQRRANQVVASWMTRQDRDLAIADNVSYAAAVVELVNDEHPGASRLVLTGFSQGVAMMFRAATTLTRRVDGVIAVGGDVPPELEAGVLTRIPRALVCRGTRDDSYPGDIFDRDVKRLHDANVTVRPFMFDGGHEWSDQVAEASGTFLRDHPR